jgi:hypothetical protein
LLGLLFVLRWAGLLLAVAVTTLWASTRRRGVLELLAGGASLGLLAVTMFDSIALES